MTSRFTRVVGAGALVVALGGSVLVCVSATASVAASSKSANSQAVPMATSAGTAGATWAVVAMGDLGQPLNTFWQLFELKQGSSNWILETPPGVADNGGLVILNGSPSSFVVGVRPNDLLHFTPTLSLDGRTGWNESKLIPGPLIAGADTFAASPTARYAAVASGGGAVLASPSTGSSWSKEATVESLATRAPSAGCKLTGIEAVTATANGSVVVGAGCSGGDEAGLFSDAGGSWHLIGPKLATLSSGGSRTILRLASAGETLVALVASSQGDKRSVVATSSRTNGASWTESRPLVLNSAARFVSAGPAGGTSEYLVWKGARLGAAVVGTDGSWSTLPPPPTGTATLAFSAPQRVDAFSVNRSTLVDWRLSAGRSRWEKSQTIAVPIEYGSSG